MTFDLATLEDFISPQIVTIRLSKVENSSFIVKRSKRDWDGCSNFPAPAFITENLN